MKMEEESVFLKKNLTEWRLCVYPKYVLLPIDENHDHVKSNNKTVVYSESSPRPLERNVRLVCSSDAALVDVLDLEPGVAHSQPFLDLVAGRTLPHGALPVAHRYGGHQYGLWVGQLGDGRALMLGEYVNSVGERWQLQLKGSGPTPYARSFDGRTILRAALREMVASEAMFHLGVPTTRAAALVVSDECVVRDVMYSGKTRRERAAVLLRLSPSWFRFGSLEILARAGDMSVLLQLTEYVIKEHFPEISLADENRFIRLFSEIAHRSLDLVAKWQGIGFTHGLLNTDNLSLLGLTLDYGPFAFVDSYDSGFVANCCDAEGRYALAKQTDVMVWSLGELYAALRPLLTTAQQAHLAHIMKTLNTYAKNKVLETFLLKIGLKKERWGDEELMEKLLDMMQHTGADFTATFRQLAELEPYEMSSESKLAEQWSLRRLSTHAYWGCWLDQYRERLAKESETEASASSAGGAGRGCGAEGAGEGLPEEERRRRMRAVNPVYVPRTWLLHRAIVSAESDDFEEVRILMRVLRNPYEVQPEAEARGYSAQPPQWALEMKISCST